MPKIVIIHGPMGGGKSTISSALSKKLPEFILLDRAYFKDTILTNVKKENRELALTLSKQVLFFMAKRLLDEGYSIILTEIRIASVKKVLGEDYTMFSFYLDCSVEECKKRDAARQQRYVRPEVVEDMHKKHGYPDKEDIIMNTEKNSVGACLDVILKEIGESR